MSDENTFYLEEVSIDEEEVDTMAYDEVPEDDDDDLEEEDFGAVLTTLKSTKALGQDPTARTLSSDDGGLATSKRKIAVGVEHKPTVMDDFIRNFLIKLNMNRTLDAFNTEWSVFRLLLCTF